MFMVYPGTSGKHTRILSPLFRGARDAHDGWKVSRTTADALLSWLRWFSGFKSQNGSTPNSSLNASSTPASSSAQITFQRSAKSSPDAGRAQSAAAASHHLILFADEFPRCAVGTIIQAPRRYYPAGPCSHQSGAGTVAPRPDGVQLTTPPVPPSVWVRICQPNGSAVPRSKSRPIGMKKRVAIATPASLIFLLWTVGEIKKSYQGFVKKPLA